METKMAQCLSHGLQFWPKRNGIVQVVHTDPTAI